MYVQLIVHGDSSRSTLLREERLLRRFQLKKKHLPPKITTALDAKSTPCRNEYSVANSKSNDLVYKVSVKLANRAARLDDERKPAHTSA